MVQLWKSLCVIGAYLWHRCVATRSRREAGCPSRAGAAAGLVEDYGFIFEGEDFSLDELLDGPGQDDCLQIATFVG